MFATNLERSTLLNNAHTTWIMDFRTLCLTAFSLQHLVQILIIIIEEEKGKKKKSNISNYINSRLNHVVEELKMTTLFAQFI